MVIRKFVVAFLFTVAAASATFYLEPLIPVGDWKWLVIAVACVAIGVWLNRSIGDMGIVDEERRVTIVELYKTLDSFDRGVVVLAFMMTFMRFMNNLTDWLFSVKENGGVQ